MATIKTKQTLQQQACSALRLAAEVLGDIARDSDQSHHWVGQYRDAAQRLTALATSLAGANTEAELAYVDTVDLHAELARRIGGPSLLVFCRGDNPTERIGFLPSASRVELLGLLSATRRFEQSLLSTVPVADGDDEEL